MIEPRTLKALQVVAAPAVDPAGATRGVNGPERRALNILRQWSDFGIAPIVTYPDRGMLWSEFKASGCALVSYEVGSKWNLAAVGELTEIIRRTDAELVHTQGPASLDLLAALAAWRCRVPFIVTRPIPLEEQTELSPIRRRVYSTIDLVTQRLAHTVVFVSRAAHERFKNRLSTRGVRTTVIHNGVKPAPPGQKPPDERRREVVIGMTAQLSAPKAWPDFIGVVEKLVARRLSVRALIVGDGPLRPAIEQDIARKGLAAHVTLVGHCADVWPVLAQLDLFLFTSRREGLSVAVLEALAAGLPIVATEVGGIREQVLEGVNGFVAAPGDIETLTDRCAQLVADQALRARMGAESRSLASLRFAESRMLHDYATLYHLAAGTGCRSLPC